MRFVNFVRCDISTAVLEKVKDRNNKQEIQQALAEILGVECSSSPTPSSRQTSSTYRSFMLLLDKVRAIAGRIDPKTGSLLPPGQSFADTCGVCTKCRNYMTSRQGKKGGLTWCMHNDDGTLCLIKLRPRCSGCRLRGKDQHSYVTTMMQTHAHPCLHEVTPAEQAESDELLRSTLNELTGTCDSCNRNRDTTIKPRCVHHEDKQIASFKLALFTSLGERRTKQGNWLLPWGEKQVKESEQKKEKRVGWPLDDQTTVPGEPITIIDIDSGKEPPMQMALKIGRECHATRPKVLASELLVAKQYVYLNWTNSTHVLADALCYHHRTSLALALKRISRLAGAEQTNPASLFSTRSTPHVEYR